MGANPNDLMSMLGGGQANQDHPHKKEPKIVPPAPQEVLEQAITAATTPATGAAALSADQQAYLDEAKQAIADWNHRQKAAYQAGVVARPAPLSVTISGVTAPISLYNALRHGETAAVNEVTTATQAHFDNFSYDQVLEASKSALFTKLTNSTLQPDEQNAVKTQLNKIYQDTQKAFVACETARLDNARVLFEQREDFKRAKDHYDQRSRFAASSSFVTKTQNPVSRINDQADFTSSLRLPPGLTKAYVNVYLEENSKFFRSVRVRAHLSDNPPKGKAAFKVHFADGTSKSVRLEGKTEGPLGKFQLDGDKLARNFLDIDHPEIRQGAGWFKSKGIKAYVGLINFFRDKIAISDDKEIIKTMVRSAKAVAAEAFAAGTPMTRFDIGVAIGNMRMDSQEQLVREMYKAFGPDIKLGTLVEELPRFQALKPRQYQPLQPAETNDNNIKKDTIYVANNGDYAVRSLDGSKVHRDTLSPTLVNRLTAGTPLNSMRDDILSETTTKGYTLPVSAPAATATPLNAHPRPFELVTTPATNPTLTS